MGRAPVIDDENDETVGRDAMLERLESTFTALQEGRLTTEDFFSFTFKTSQRNKQVRCPRLEPIFKHPSPYIAFGYEVRVVIKRHKMTTWSLISIQLVIPILVVASVLIRPVGASPIHAADHHPLTLTAGKDGTIPFKCSNDHQSNMPKYYTVTIEGKHRPFYLDGSLDPEGLMSPDQAERFHVEYIENENEMSIEIHIVSVSLKDQGTYIVMVIIPGEIVEPRLMKQVVIIYIPPAPAICFLRLSESILRPYEVQCHTKPRNGNSTLTCFQNNMKIPYKFEGGNDNHIVNRRAFWLMDPSSPVSCCAHDIKEIATIYEALCNQFQWSPAHHPDQTEKISTKKSKVLTTRPSSSDSEMQLPPVQTTIHSGCAQNWSKAILPLVTTMVAFAARPYIVI